MPSLSHNLRRRRAINAACKPQPPSVADELAEAVRLHEGFLASLNDGWLAHAVGDIGMLNDALLKSHAALSRYDAEKKGRA